jgi:tetratricopeptide (TPR) repeat protein
MPANSSVGHWPRWLSCPTRAGLGRWPACSKAGPCGLWATWRRPSCRSSAWPSLPPEQLEAWLGLGWCYKRLGRLGDAITALRTGLEAAPSQPLLLYNLACYHSLAGDVTAAVDHLTKAISIDDQFRDLTGAERDFDPIRSDPRFVAVTHVVV